MKNGLVYIALVIVFAVLVSAAIELHDFGEPENTAMDDHMIDEGQNETGANNIVTAVIFDYRGYGDSQGRPSEVGTYRDARAAWKWLVEQKKIAAEKNRNIILVFQGSDWCRPCMKLNKDVWTSKEFKTYGITEIKQKSDNKKFINSFLERLENGTKK